MLATLCSYFDSAQYDKEGCSVAQWGMLVIKITFGKKGRCRMGMIIVRLSGVEAFFIS